MRDAPVSDVRGPFIHAPVWSWDGRDVLLVRRDGFRLGVRRARLRRRRRSPIRAIARKVALGAVAPAPVLLIADLGRPERFLNMMRIFKPRSPMNMGAWCLVAFSGSGALAVGGDLIGRPKAARALGALTSLLGAISAPTPACCSPAPRSRCGRAAARSSARPSSPPRPRPARPPRGSCSWRVACRTAIRPAGRSARSRPPRC